MRSCQNLRETLSHFRTMRRMPDTAFEVISLNLIASISSTVRSARSIGFGRGMLAGSWAWPGPRAPLARALIGTLLCGWAFID